MHRNMEDLFSSNGVCCSPYPFAKTCDIFYTRLSARHNYASKAKSMNIV